MPVRDYATLEAEVDRGDSSKLQIDIRLYPASRGPTSPGDIEIERAIREALREAQLERLMLASNPQPKRRGWLGRVFAFVVCVGLGAVATLALTAYHPRPSAIAGLEDLGSLVATPGSQSNPVRGPSASPQSPASAGAAESEPGPGTFGLHQQ
jgi:hypothetical protein